MSFGVSEPVALYALQDCRDGTYKAVVRMEKAGLTSIHAQINGQPLGAARHAACAAC